MNCEHEPIDMRPTEETGWWQCPCGHKTWIQPGRLLEFFRERRLAREARASS